jgi:TM2 domain-containing membrane protein YozV
MAINEEPEIAEPTPIHLTPPLPATPEPPAGTAGIESKRILAAAFAFMTGAFGVHKFILGQTREGFIRLGITVLLVWTILAPVAMMVIGMVEGVIYFTKTDDDFIRTYQQGHKNWF